MENAVEALKTAAAVLIFIIAITVAFTMFSKAKATADAIITSKDQQEYLESAELDNGILYTSSEAIATGDTENQSVIPNMTTNGNRIVKADDVIATIYRYYLEKYGVTIIDGKSGTIIARFDSATENFVQTWTENIQGKNNYGNLLDADDLLEKYEEQIKNNIKNSYVTINKLDLKELYEVENTKRFGAPWYGTESEIIKRINADVRGTDYTKNGEKYKGKNLSGELNNVANKIIEVVNEIDTSKYLIDNGVKTNLQQEYQLPTIEVVYIIQ